MGAKIPGRLKTRRPTCKCDICDCSFLNIQALRSHQACVHPKNTKRVAYKPKTEVIARRKLVPAKKVLKSGNMRIKIAPDKALTTNKFSKYSADNSKPYNTRRTEFECPVCAKIFTVYFSAYRHIQKNHCINEEGDPVSPNSSHLIKPVRIELCTSCNKRVVSNQPHNCAAFFSIDEACARTSYTCLGCEQSFTSLHMFEVHIPGLHSDEAENLFFPDIKVFTSWKEDMESQIEIKFLMLTKRANYQLYHCNHLTADDKTSHFCPSSFTVQEFSKGIQVAFFKEHFGHKHNVYKIPEKFKKYLITSLMNNSECYTVTNVKCDDDDTYMQFKKLMNNIILTSTKVNMADLNVLLGKALEMTAILKKYDDDDSSNADANKSITDVEITKILDKSAKKRKAEVVEDSISKRLRKDSTAQKPEVEPVKTEESKPQVKEIKPYNTKVNRPKDEDTKNKPEMQSPSSFSESYKIFVDASYKVTEKPQSRTKVDNKKKEIVKTKVGQFKPNPLPKDEIPFKKTIVSPKLKTDFDYEVKERENDCNILIIKI